MLAFEDGTPNKAAYPDTNLILQMLGLGWKTPPEDVLIIGDIGHADKVSVESGILRR